MIKKIVLAEYWDDFEFAQKIMSAVFGTESNEDDIGEKVGEERLGSSRFVDNLGLTLISMSALFAVILLVVVVSVYIIKRKGYQGKVK